MINHINLKVLVIDTDFYALRALNSYLAWDRRTRVVALANDLAQAWDFLAHVAPPEYPDVIVLDMDASENPDSLHDMVIRLRQRIGNPVVLCLARRPDPAWTAAAFAAGAQGVLLRNEVRLHLVGAILYARAHLFTVTPSIRARADADAVWLSHAELLPGEREFPTMSERIRQALWLCVIEGMPAQLAADEMGISPHTLRSYIKQGYRILEMYDDAEYPADMGPLERAFLRFTALDWPGRQSDRPPDGPTRTPPDDDPEAQG